MRTWILILLTLLLALPQTACRKDDPTELEVLIDWIWEGMNEAYYWTEEIDPSLYPTDETDPEEYFYSLLYSDDRFSWIVDDYQALINSFAGIEKTNGISPYFIRLRNSDEVIALVQFVVEGSPADSAGIVRGDIITDVNGESMDIDNYSDLFYSESVSLEFADRIGDTLRPNEKSASLTAIEIDANPVHYSEVIEYENSRIGYLVYTQFTSGKNDKWLNELNNTLLNFKSSSLDAVVIDLRYNRGGSIYMANHLASALVPSDVTQSENVFVNLRWNDLYQTAFEEMDGEDSPSLVSYFEINPSINLNLDEVYFLTSRPTASASELTIIGVEPYINDVTIIGDTTYGKPYGSITIEDFEDPPRHNWAMQPITFKYANALGFSDFVDGLVPDVYIYDNLFEAKPFGDITDPILAKALELITDVPPVTKKSLEAIPVHKGLENPKAAHKNRAYLDDRMLIR
jgi:C-terminal processing protease CtpA/Prc